MIEIQKVRERFSELNASSRRSLQNFKSTGWMFTPGVMFMLLGLAALIAPRFLIAIAAAFLLMFGVVFCFLAWKLLQFKRKVDSIANSFRGRVIVEGVHVKNVFDRDQAESSEESHKKIIVH